MAEYEKMEFTSHSKHIKKYIHMWNNSHGKLTGNWQKSSNTVKIGLCQCEQRELVTQE